MKTQKMIDCELKYQASINNKLNLLHAHWLRITLGVTLAILAVSLSAQTLQEYNTMIAVMNASPDSTVRKEAAHLDSLLFQLQTTIFLNNLVQTVVGQSVPVCLQTDDESIGMLSVADPVFAAVELITINIYSPGDLNFVLNLAALPGFQQLKYIQLLCMYQVDPEALATVFTANNPALVIFYNISVPN